MDKIRKNVRGRPGQVTRLLFLLAALLLGGLFRRLGLGLASASAAYLEHLGPADRARSRSGVTPVLHGDLLLSLHFPLCFTLDTVTLCCQRATSSAVGYKNS